ncbi:toll-interacting protein B-like [Daphnia pulex]|uniref:toll-interacting protein B-like n=1 Tax=Daphnia pulex TaxID=6669 RepID=UPI001EDF8424|nr:toll-interacting protein B-like [Daphnia pulex]
MASAGSGVPSDSNAGQSRYRQRTAVLGNLPDDFLRPDSLQGSNPSHQERIDRELAIQLHQQQRVANIQYVNQSYAGQLIITIVEASFVKNYGVTRMDPYVRVRIGHTIYETPACPSGGRTPRWNKRIQSYLPTGVKSISIEVYDECALTMDELIAYGQIPIPEIVFRGESADQWLQLSGKQGEHKEGSIHMIFTLLPIAAPQLIAPGTMGFAMAPAYGGYPLVNSTVVPVGQTPIATPMMVMPGYAPSCVQMPIYNTANPALVTPQGNLPVASRPKPLTQEEIKEIMSMFPTLDPQVVQSVIDACDGRREAIVDSLLQISEQ